MMVKVGDRVRALVTEFDVREGGVYKVDSIGEDGGVRIIDDVGDAYFMYDDQVELIQSASDEFKVGDKVRVIKSGEGHYGSGHECDLGTITEITSVDKYGDEVEYLTETDWFFYAHEIEPVDAPLTIQSGGYYKTRDGRKVGPIYANEYDNECWSYKSGGSMYYKDTGYSCPGAAHLHNDAEDLIAEWPETNSDILDELEDWMADNPLPVIDTTTAGFTVPLDAPEFGGGGPAVSKFKVGDRVVTDGGYSFDPNEGVIAKNNVDDDSDLYKVVVPGTDSFDGDGWHFRTSQLRLVAPATSGSANSTDLGSTAGFTVPLDAQEFAVRKFSVGDRVQFGDIAAEDDPGTITGFDGGYYSVQWDSDDDNTGAFIWGEDELRLVAKATTAQEEPDALTRLQMCDFIEAKEMARTGIFTINEVRKKFGLPSIADGNKLAA